MMDISAVGAYRTGQWRDVSVGLFGLLVLTAALLDIVTTAVILTTPTVVEFNQTLDTLAGVHVAVAILVHAGIALTLVALAWFSLGWLSTTAGWFALFGFGSVGLNNLVGISTGVWLFEHLPVEMGWLAHYGIPVAALGVGVGLVYYRYRSIPTGELLTVSCGFSVVSVLPLLVL